VISYLMISLERRKMISFYMQMKSRASGDNVTKEQESWLNNAYKSHIFFT